MAPCVFWHHQHIIEPHGKGVLMTDIVSYKPPLWILGDMANHLFIRKQLKGIFDYRKMVIEELFGG